MKRKTQYQRNPHMQPEYPKHRKELVKLAVRQSAWRRVLFDNPSRLVMQTIADLLARLGYEPDEKGLPIGNWPPVSKMDTRVYLDSLVENTLEYRADNLEAAMLVWAGVIELTQEQIQEACPQAIVPEVAHLLEMTGFDAFMCRRGYARKQADIRQAWESGERVMDREKLRNMLKRYKGST